MNVPWTEQELAILGETYPDGGVVKAMARLPGRTRQSIYVKANKLRLTSAHRNHAPVLALAGAQLEEAMGLRAIGWSHARIGEYCGFSEATVANAVIIEEGRCKGYRPLSRDEYGRLHPESIETLRLLMRKGWKARDIQERCGVSASCVAEQRRRYQLDLKARGKAALPPPGGGEAYSGAAVPRASIREVEQLYLDGFGARKIHEQTGVSPTTIGRIRTRLVKRLKRKGECLPGCDLDGRRRKVRDSRHFIPPAIVDQLRMLLLDRVPVLRAANICGIGASSAYRLRDALRAELEQRGEQLPPPLLPGRVVSANHPARTAGAWLPAAPKMRARYRALCHAMSAVEARATIVAEIDADRAADAQRRREEASRPLTFEEQLERVRSGQARIVRRIPIPTRALPDAPLGGFATGML